MDNTDKLDKKAQMSYPAHTVPPAKLLIFLSIQHLLLALSLGLAVPVTVGRAIGLSVSESTSLLCATLLAMGITTILQTLKLPGFGSGYQSISVSDSAALSACIMAAQIGGLPLMFAMTIFSGILKLVMSLFVYRMRKLFPPEVTGTLIFLLGISLIPTTAKCFLGANAFVETGVYNPLHLLASVLTLLIMLSCVLFLKKLKVYSVLIGTVGGFLLCISLGIFNLDSLSQLAGVPFLQLPVRSSFEFSFNSAAIIPFVVVTVAGVVDNIGDFSAGQSANDPHFQRPDWHSIANGLRASSVGILLAGLLGGTTQSTATPNIGIAGATGVTSRSVAYLTGGMLITLSFFPAISGLLVLIPEPVLGAILVFSVCYIMSGGFGTLASRALDERRIFLVFISVIFSISTLIPGLYDFLPKSVQQTLISPMVLGVLVLMIMRAIVKVGTKKTISLSIGVSPESIRELNKKLTEICAGWGTSRELLQKLTIALNALCESICAQDPDAECTMKLMYDEMQFALSVRSPYHGDEPPASGDGTVMGVSLLMMGNMFDNVRVKVENSELTLTIDTDI